jgi:hypothetical protein
LTFNAKASLDRARRIIQDESSVRWPLAEWRLWLNDGLREIALLKPTAFSTSVVISLVAGTYQRQDAYVKVLHVSRNLKSTQDSPRLGARAIRAVDRDMLDTASPDWHDPQRTRARKEVRNVVFDDNEPMAFYVYPPNDGTGIVEAIVSKIPAGVPLPADPADVENIDAYDVDVDISDIYSNVILDYMLYRAYSKDAQFAGSAQRAAAYYQQFSNALGISAQTDLLRNVSADRAMPPGGQPQ